MRPDLDASRYGRFTNFLGQKRYFTKEWGTFGNYQKNGAEMVISQKNWGKNGIIPFIFVLGHHAEIKTYFWTFPVQKNQWL